MNIARNQIVQRTLALIGTFALVSVWLILPLNVEAEHNIPGGRLYHAPGDDDSTGERFDDRSDTFDDDDRQSTGGCDYYYVGSGRCGSGGGDDFVDDRNDRFDNDFDFDNRFDDRFDNDFDRPMLDPCRIDDHDDRDDDQDDDDLPGAQCPLTGTDLSDITNYPPPNGPIVAFGNSLTVGVGASPGEDYVSELEERLNVSIVNEGEPGDTTEDALQRLDEDVLERDPSVVIIWLGGNDELRRIYELLQDTSEFTELEDELDELVDELDLNAVEDMPLLTREETFENIETIIDAIQDTGAVTILVGFDPVLYDPSIADNYEDIAEDTGSIFVPDIYNGIFGRSSRMSDLIHPNDAGYDIIADRIAPALQCALPER